MIAKYRCLIPTLLLSLVCAATARADITNNLSLYLPLNETTGLNVTDASPNGNNGTLVGFVGDDSQWVAGKIAGGIQVDVPTQTAQYVSVPQAANLDFGTNGAVTVAAWVKSTGAQLAGSAIICKGTGGGNEEYDLDISAASAGKFRIVTRNNANTASTLLATVGPTATFQHVAAVIDANAHTLKIYINGQLNASSSPVAVTNIKTSSHVVSIGNRQSLSAAYNLPFVSGVIDDVHIYGRALTASDVFELYASHGNAPIISAQPKAYTCYAGDVAAFAVTVDAVNSVVPVFYQWQLNGTNLLNATNATLGITNVQVSMSGQPVSVIITNLVGTTNSASATLTVLPLPAADIVSDLAGYYKFDDAPGSSTAADSTTNATTGTLIGFSDTTGVWTNGLINGALNFNADASTVNLVAIPNVFTPVPPALDFSTNGLFTLAAWVNGSATQISGAAVFAKGTGGGGEQFAVDISGGHYRYYLRNAAGAVSTVTTTVGPNGTWQHIICVLNTSNGVMNCYINGQLAGESIAPTNLLASTHEISIGNRQSGTGSYNLPWTGLIDDVRFYNRTFTAVDAQALYLQGGVFPPTFVTQPIGASLFVGDNFRFTTAVNGTAPLSYQWLNGSTVLPGATNPTLSFLPTVASNAGNYTLVVTNAYGSVTSSVTTLTLAPFTVNSALAAYWAFDDGSGSSIAADASGNANNGNLTSFPDFTSEWITGRINGGLIFNQPGSGATNEYVDIPNAPSLNFSTTSNFSLAAWVRGSTLQVSGAGIITKGFGSLNEQYTIDVASGFYRFYVRNSAGTVTQITSTTGAPTGRWQHLVATYDGIFATMSLYLDGVLIASSAAAPTALLVDNGHDVSIGSREQTSISGYNFPFNGSIDDVRIYKRTLTSNDVQTVFQAAGLLAPVFYTQPLSNASLFVGDNLTLNTFVDGTAPVTLQWQKNGSNIPNATNSSLSLLNIQLADAGTYALIASNAVTSVSSSNSVIVVNTFSITNTAAYFKFDETTGSTAADSSGNGNTGTLISFPGDDSEWTPGRINNGLTFNADTFGQTVVTAPDSPTLNFSNGLAFSVVAWVRGTPVQANGAGVVAKGAGGGGEQYAIDIHSDLLPAQTYRFFVRNGAGVSIPLPTTVAPNGRWQHVAATFDGSAAATMNVYVNGQIVASNTAPGSLLVSTHELSVGNRQSSAASSYNLPFTGQLDDVRIYSRALRTSEIQSIYALATTFGPVVYSQPTNLTAYTGTTATFAPAVDGTDPLTYQWSKNGNPIASATSSILALTNVQLSDAGSYSLHVTGAGSPTNTVSATLTVVAIGFSGATTLPDGTFQMTITGPPNSSYHVYTSPTVNTPFAQWSLFTLGTLDGSGSAVIVDPTPTSNNPSLYYRFTLP